MLRKQKLYVYIKKSNEQREAMISVGPPVTRSSRHVVVGCQLRKVVVD
jgi:hypothetical protein